jgi:iron complex transport system substrate-binding protein
VEQREGPSRRIVILRWVAVAVLALLYAARGCPHNAPSPNRNGADEGGTPSRVVSLSPNLTEIACAIGARDLLVGRSDFCDYPESVLELPAVGGYTNPSLEKIVSLKPDLVLLTEAEKPVADRLKPLDIRALVVPNETIADILSSIDRLGEALDRRNEAEALRNKITSALERARNETSHAEKPKVLMIADRAAGTLSGAFAVGKGNFLNELIEICGGENVYGDSPVPYPIISREYLIGVGPEVIIESAPDLGDDPQKIAARRADWEREMPMLPAVKNGRVYVITEKFLTIPGPRIVLALEKLKGIIPPDS